ncbi:hypothetical protein ACH37Y_06165 [Sphingomonas paucimobilis]|uniref:hypothetical protein n=1 Tax=Sphingomonas paucimobilis TaxID=13689 RepID=UPI003789846D
MADIPESTKSEHVSWTVNATSYLRNLDSEDLDAETIAVHYQKAPEKTETGTRISLCFPTLIVSGYCSEPREVADRVARILNAHWDEPAAPPAMDREAAYRQALEDVCNPLGYLQRMADAEGAKLSGMAYAIASDIGTIQHIAKEALSTLSADAIRQGEGFKWPEPKFVPVESGAKLNPKRVEAAFQLINGELVIGEQFQLIGMLLEGTDYTVVPATPASHASDGGKA